MHCRVTGGQELDQAVTGGEAGHTVGRWPVHHKLHRIPKNPTNNINTWGRRYNLSNLFHLIPCGAQLDSERQA
ncbi:unnamed protein product [Menidia menidia]|uniref:(Atlantic silverside) hypothetical protein n=1 Tax=Menidia menidia TaxID=238744 RepID=A0A8S4ABQ4_9TELE|nr:unnamed protein product [Menidia menidia]